MYGYIRFYKAQLSPPDYERYKSVYCSLCHALADNFGQLPRFMLSYDLTFMVLLAEALTVFPQDTDPLFQPERCLEHFGKKTAVAHHWSCLDYAANISVLLAEQKLLDDQADKEHLLRTFGVKRLFQKTFRQAATNYPEIAAEIKAGMLNFNRLESLYRHNYKNIEALLPAGVQATCAEQIKQVLAPLLSCCPAAYNCTLAFAAVIGEIFRCLPLLPLQVPPTDRSELTTTVKKQLLSPCLEVIGIYLGAWIYLIDALDDLSDDLRRQQYNILLMSEKGKLIRQNYERKLLRLQQLPLLLRRQKHPAKKTIYRDKGPEELTEPQKQIADLLHTAQEILHNLQALLDQSLILLPWQRDAALIAALIQQGLPTTLWRCNFKQRYQFDLLQLASAPDSKQKDRK